MALPYQPKIYPIDSLKDFIEAVEQYAPQISFFRGEPDYYEFNFMRAKALRSMSNSTSEHIADPLDISFRMMNDFYRQVGHRITEVARMNFSAFAQHYGVPTNLLDITNSPIIALYFACQQRDLTKRNPWRRRYLHQNTNVSKSFNYGFVYTFDKYVDATEFLRTIPGRSNLIKSTFLENSQLLQQFANLVLSIKLETPAYFEILLNKIRTEYINIVSESFPDRSDSLIQPLFLEDPLAYKAIKDLEKGIQLEPIGEDYDVFLYCIIAVKLFRLIISHSICLPHIDFLPNFLYRPENSFARIQNQQGQFFYQTLLPVNNDLNDDKFYSVQRLAIGPVIFEIHNKKRLLKSLDKMGINLMTIMNDFDSIAKYVVSKYYTS